LATKNDIISLKSLNTPVAELTSRIKQVFNFLKSIKKINEVEKLKLAEEQVSYILKEIEQACSSSQKQTEQIRKLQTENCDHKQKLNRSEENTLREKERIKTLSFVMKRYIKEINILRNSQRVVFQSSHQFHKETMNLINQTALAKQQDINDKFEAITEKNTK
jgi:hypothetical protein